MRLPICKSMRCSRSHQKILSMPFTHHPNCPAFVAKPFLPVTYLRRCRAYRSDLFLIAALMSGIGHANLRPQSENTRFKNGKLLSAFSRTPPVFNSRSIFPVAKKTVFMVAHGSHSFPTARQCWVRKAVP